MANIPTDTPHGWTPREMDTRALELALVHVKRELTRTAKTKAEQIAAALFLDLVMNAGERLRNDAAARYNVYPLGKARTARQKALDPRPTLDADRLLEYELGHLLLVAAERADEATKSQRLYG